MKKLKIILIAILLIGLNGWIIGQQSQAQPSTQKIASPQSYITQGPISISDDGTLKTYDLDALGTVDDPIVIENYNITPTLDQPLIYITGTTLHFRIANNLLNGSNLASLGIHLDDVQNGTIKNNTVANAKQWGIALTSSPNNIITQNDVHNNSETGIGLSDNSDNCTIFNNSVYKNAQSGIQTSLSSNVTISYNTVYENDGQGINPSESYNSTVNDNSVYSNGEGISLYFSDYNKVCNNTIIDSYWGHGIRFENTTDYNIVDNNFISNNAGTGISIMNSCENNTLSNNELRGNGHGISLTTDSGVGFNKNNTISQNIISNNRYSGIKLEIESDNNYISNNLIFDNEHWGLELRSPADNNIIQFNDLAGNGDGTGPQALDEGINNIFSTNYWSDWTGTGSYSFDGNDDTSPQTNPNHMSAPDITAPTSAIAILKDSVNIQWIASTDTFGHSITYSAFYSTTDGTTWNKIVSGLTGTSYNWDLSTIFNGTEVLLKVEAEDSLGFISVSVSDSTFVIENPELVSTTTTTTTTKIAPGWDMLLLILSLLVLVPASRYRKKR